MNVGAPPDWYYIRDLFLGFNYKPRNSRYAVSLARASHHPTAQWLSSLFNGIEKVPKKAWEIVLILENSTEAEAFTYRGILRDNYDTVREGAIRGSVLAQSLMLRIDHSWVDNIVQNHQNDPVVLYNLSKSFKTTNLSLLAKSAELGHLDAMILYSSVGYSKYDIKRLTWLTDDVLNTRSGKRVLNQMLAHYPNVPNQFLYHFAILLKRRQYAPTAVIVMLHDSARYNCRCAVSEWLLVARKLGVVKDIRLLIGTSLWKCAWKWMEKEDYKEQCKIDDFFKPKIA